MFVTAGPGNPTDKGTSVEKRSRRTIAQVTQSGLLASCGA